MDEVTSRLVSGLVTSSTTFVSEHFSYPWQTEQHLRPRQVMQLHQIVISPGHDYWVRKGEATLQHGTQSPEVVVCEAGRGLVGDRYYHGRQNRKGQVTFIDKAVIQDIRDRFDLPELNAGLLRRNLVVAEADLSALLGKRFELQGVEFEGSQECRPCDWMDRMIAPGVKDYLAEHFRGGLRAQVCSTGRLVIETLHRAANPQKTIANDHE